MYYLYILFSKNCKRTYTGISGDVQKRLIQHNSNYNFSTKNCGDWIIIYQEESKNRQEARKLEKYFKKGSGREKIKDILSKYLSEKSN